jgi:hypothetical protein
MPERTRSIVGRLRRFIGDRRRAKRVEARLDFTLLPEALWHRNGRSFDRALAGYTLDISSTGFALIVPAIRIEEHYLVGQDPKLRLKLNLPLGPVEMEIVPVRYESLEDDEADRGYLIGAKIVEIEDDARARFDHLVESLLNPAPPD